MAKTVTTEGGFMRVKRAVGGALAAPVVGYHKARGLVSDIKRGHSLWKDGYGEKYDSALKVAKKGTSGPRRK